MVYWEKRQASHCLKGANNNLACLHMDESINATFKRNFL